MAIDKPHASYGIWRAKVDPWERKTSWQGVDMDAEEAMSGKISMDFGTTSVPWWFSFEFLLQRKPLL